MFRALSDEQRAEIHKSAVHVLARHAPDAWNGPS
jgi:hypothetical protein